MSDWRQIFWYNLEWKKAWWFQKGELNFLKFEWDFKINLASLCAAASKFSARYDNNAFDLRIGRVAERQRNLFVTLNDSVFNYVSLTSNIYIQLNLGLVNFMVEMFTISRLFTISEVKFNYYIGVSYHKVQLKFENYLFGKYSFLVFE